MHSREATCGYLCFLVTMLLSISSKTKTRCSAKYRLSSLLIITAANPCGRQWWAYEFISSVTRTILEKAFLYLAMPVTNCGKHFNYVTSFRYLKCHFASLVPAQLVTQRHRPVPASPPILSQLLRQFCFLIRLVSGCRKAVSYSTITQIISPIKAHRFR